MIVVVRIEPIHMFQVLTGKAALGPNSFKMRRKNSKSIRLHNTAQICGHGKGCMSERTSHGQQKEEAKYHGGEQNILVNLLDLQMGIELELYVLWPLHSEEVSLRKGEQREKDTKQRERRNA